MPLAIHKLNLSRFRNHAALRLAPEGAPMVVLAGENGAGKTNILEAVSLFAPGRGLRGAELAEMQSRAEPLEPWAVAAEIATPDGLTVRAGTGLARDGLRRVLRVDGKDAPGRWPAAAVWLTPQMDRMFAEGAALRRRFLDRLACACDSAHAGRVAGAEKAMRERLRLLREGGRDAAWLSALEKQMAEDFAAVGAARLALVARLQGYVAAEGDIFPVPLLSVAGEVEGLLRAGGPALAAEEEMRARLARNRAADAEAGRTLLGAHRSDLRVIHAAKGTEAGMGSTGEQKGLLISIVLAHAAMMRAEKGFAPLLLLDEVAAHLDAARREALFARLAATGGQVWMTGTDAAVFAGIGDARLYTVRDGQVAEGGALKAVS